MKVSVIIPFFNSGALLRRTINSVLEQTYSNLEVIIVDDGSTDDSYEIASEYISSHVTVLKQQNSGASIARNTGLLHAKGDFIQFLDAGDFIDKDKIAIQVDALLQSPGKVAVCNYKQFTSEDDLMKGAHVDQSSFLYSSKNPQDFLINLWGGKGEMNFIQTNCWLIPRGVILRAGNWRPYRCPDDDGEFFTRVLLASDGIEYTPGVYNYYYIAPKGLNQLSRSQDYKHLMNSLLTIDLKFNSLKNCGYHPLLNRAIAAQYYRFAIDMYPARKNLSAIAWKRFRNLSENPPKIFLGGSMIQLVYIFFGWRTARLIRFYFRGS